VKCEAWVDGVTQLLQRLWGLKERTRPQYLHALHFERAPTDIRDAIQAGLQVIRTEGCLFITIDSAGDLTTLKQAGVHQLKGGACLIAQPVSRNAPFQDRGPLWFGVATHALEKVAPTRVLLSRISALQSSHPDGLEAKVAALLAIECGGPGAVEGLHHLTADDLSPAVLLKIQTLWRWEITQLAALQRSHLEAIRQLSDASVRATRAEKDLEIARADHRANIGRLTKGSNQANLNIDRSE
jgi:hypothetical protein